MPQHRFTIAQLIVCAQRELGLRDHVYPRLITSGKMTREKAEQEKAMMRAIIEELQEREREERLL